MSHEIPNDSYPPLKKLPDPRHQLTTYYVAKRKRKHLCEKVMDAKELVVVVGVVGPASSFF
jgi:hypothetical protein